MTADQLALIPSDVLYALNTEALREWLWQRGMTMTLLELDQERRRRRTKRGTHAAS
jgi:hypothetical protein